MYRQLRVVTYSGRAWHCCITKSIWSAAILVGLLVVFPLLQACRMSLRTLIALSFATTAGTTAAWGLLVLEFFREEWHGVAYWPFVLQCACVFNAWSYSTLRTAIVRAFPIERSGIAIGAFSTSNILCFALGKVIYARIFGLTIKMPTVFGQAWLGRGALLFYIAGFALALCVPIALSIPLPLPAEKKDVGQTTREDKQLSTRSLNRLLLEPTAVAVVPTRIRGTVQ